ncbi:Short chain dehydrogenase/reductase, putative [Alloalcanivorax dieselolei B5]|uniref:Short chain dehydrogenase/reductase, putative n=1 Tax=Alcanivorax dieselolei (strain DSM 16502 / CGMCC 1.3690 / MCCC 1A00001 / B-5) TaxID=930169 RepID=K0CC18_ALCDB|nr:SDR family oxidoreductase [Alloalcanivorax dieselolei]AFT69197.1 Short chain dehydrogenase/reductase, putative [Alloalcanivorax dieselolei B5]GGJ83300.1 short-chain dehydrogenase [Alloalcanivorax dieselolei]
MIPATTKSILITGAASGIGLATARHFHQHGWRVGLLDVNETALAGLARDLDGAWFHPLDVTDAEACARAVSAFSGDGALDALFNCAGILRMGRFEAISAEQHKRIIDINVTGLVNMSLAALPALRRADAPVVINMSSASALYGVPHLASYSASKFAVRGLTEALNIEWKRLGIRVVDVMPPFVKTPMVEEADYQAPVVSRLGVKLKAEDIAAKVWEAAAREVPVHNPVGGVFKMIKLLDKLLPSASTRLTMTFLSRE